MTPFCARILALCFLAATLAGVSGCKSNSVEAAVEMSGPPTFNATYQARNPRKCAKVTSTPTVAEATALVQCSNESDTSGSSTPLITLATDLEVEMGSPRNYIPGTDDRSDIDPSAKVIPIRGQGTMWQCSPAASYPAGQNCANYPAGAGGQGVCYKTTFGDWKCRMSIGSPRQVLHLKGPTAY